MVMPFRGVGVVEVGNGSVSLILPIGFLRLFPKLISSIQLDT